MSDDPSTATAPAAPESSGALGDYRRRKLVLAESIQELMTIAHERRDDEREHSAREVLATLAEDAFQLAVVGQFSRGKSTLMNAILGGSYLPTGALPMTSVLTTVRYGSKPRAKVRRAGRDLEIDVPLDELVRYVAQHSGERQDLQIISADIELPVEILRLGFSFVDTPGIGSAIQANTATTEEFLPRADAVIFVTSCDAPLSRAEQTFLVDVRRHVEKLFLVVNKTDLVSPEEAQGVIRFICGQLATENGTDVRVFALSARRALQATISGDRAGLVDSGLLALEEPLTRFLTAEKSRVFLKQTCGRAQRALARQQADLQLARAAQAQEKPAREDTSRRFDHAVEGLAGEAHRLAIGARNELASSLAPLLLERSRGWPAELKQAITEKIGVPEAGHISRREMQQQLAAIRDATAILLEDLAGERAAEVHTLLFNAAGEQIQALLELRHQTQPLAARILGVGGANDSADGWSPADLPPLRAPRVPFGELLKPPARGRGRQLADVLDTAVDLYCQQVRDGFAHAAEDWTADLLNRVQRDLKRDADRVRKRLETTYQDEHATRLRKLENSLTAFQRDVAAWKPAPSAQPEMNSAAVARRPAAEAACVICQEVGTVPFDYLAHAQYELATRPDCRAEHAAAGGFCPLHTWLYAQTADPVGISLTYAELAARLAAQLQTTTDDDEAQTVLSHFTPGPRRCPVCRALWRAEHTAITELVEQLGEEDQPPVNLCAAHLAVVIAAHPPGPQANALVGRFAETLLRAAEDMRTFALKRQSLRRGLLNHEEQSAPMQTILRVAGHRELARPWRTDEDDRLP